jgi:hypothetical protein
MRRGRSSLMKALNSAISDMKAFDLKAEISGTIQDYDLKLSSDLDNVLRDVVKNQVKAQVVQFEKRLQSSHSGKSGWVHG